jgi:hypothetical protein
MSQQLHRENRATGFIPGSEQFGGAVLENRTFSPYSNSSWRMGTTQADQEAREYKDAMDDIRMEGDSAHLQAMRNATEIQKLTDLEQINKLAGDARETARRQKALAWSMRLANNYPNRAHLYTVEALLGQMVSSDPSSFPRQNQPAGGANPLIQGSTPAPAPRPQAPPAQGNPLIKPTGNPLIR